MHSSVLDGQHRLWGYQKCAIRHRVPVAIYSGLTRAEEARLFIDINTTQKGVPAALLLDIKQLAEYESKRETLLRELFDRLQRDSHSPIAGKLSAAKSLTGRISRVTFNKAVSTALSSGVLLDAAPEARYRLILNFLNAFDAELPNKDSAATVSIFRGNFEDSGRSREKFDGTSWQRQTRVHSEDYWAAMQLDFGATAGGRATPTKKAIATAMQAALRTAISLSDEML